MTKGQMEAMKWFSKRVRRTHEKLLEMFHEECEMELMGLPGETRRTIHTEALFHALRDIHQPDALADGLDEELLVEYAEFIAEKHKTLVAMCQEIRGWTPAQDKAAQESPIRKAAMN